MQVDPGRPLRPRGYDIPVTGLSGLIEQPVQRAPHASPPRRPPTTVDRRHIVLGGSSTSYMPCRVSCSQAGWNETSAPRCRQPAQGVSAGDHGGRNVQECRSRYRRRPSPGPVPDRGRHHPNQDRARCQRTKLLKIPGVGVVTRRTSWLAQAIPRGSSTRRRSRVTAAPRSSRLPAPTNNATDCPGPVTEP
ncbi:hypothetical protein R1CP_36320 (plasmid) [Rhodococcus opacus]|uniref:Uncharacterized protein n=1 Tax=Rhodococcus opacus TaxID=37919 RepID=A0A1B1KH22_RHOOP|nr:hypothetical protein R1CP_36320 [Rhodococcus opacus]